jgi:hypothetical protein
VPVWKAFPLLAETTNEEVRCVPSQTTSQLDPHPCAVRFPGTRSVTTSVATVLVFAVFVRRVLRQHDPAPIARISLVLGVLAVATIVVFFSGLPSVLAAAAVCTALAARERAGEWTAVPRVAIALSTVAILLAVFLAIAG